jgi:hypothetical protein
MCILRAFIVGCTAWCRSLPAPGLVKCGHASRNECEDRKYVGQLGKGCCRFTSFARPVKHGLRRETGVAGSFITPLLLALSERFIGQACKLLDAQLDGTREQSAERVPSS